MLAEITYPIIDPILLDLGPVKVRWYGVCYIIAFVLAALVLRGLSQRGRWPVPVHKVIDVLFWGILGVFVGGRLGYFLFYGLSLGYEWWQIIEVHKGGMSFHGGLLGVIVAYWVYAKKAGLPRGELFDGLSLATAPGVAVVRLGNFVNAELWGRPWEGAWAMRFPRYGGLPRPFGTNYAPDSEGWFKARADGVPEDFLFEPLRHPSQLYEMLTEGIILYFVLRFLMLRLGWGGGRIAASFLVLYGSMRFFVEQFRDPDVGIGFQLGTWLTRGQVLCVGMMLVGAVVWLLCKPYPVPDTDRPEGAPGE
ncbi:MAG: prolipoprotein diacylglyceryl transferase [Planctomycetota bacterium]|nr:prolipoprotein diacylglyceryl transferase [Planctomycetota bacterium]